MSHFNVKYPEIFCSTGSVETGKKRYTELTVLCVSTNTLPKDKFISVFANIWVSRNGALFAGFISLVGAYLRIYGSKSLLDENGRMRPYTTENFEIL